MADQEPWLEQFEQRRKEREDADRSFTLLGETLVVKANVAPELALRLADFQAKVAKYQIEATAAQAKGDPIPDLGVDDKEFLELSESIVVACLEPDSLESWARLRAPDHPDPLSLMDIYGLAGFLLAKASRLPTVAPAASSNGHQAGRRTSGAGSSSKAGARKR